LSVIRAYNELLATALQLTGPTGDPATFNNSVQGAHMNALGGLYEGLLRSPELADLLIEAREEQMGTAVRRPALPGARGTHGGTAQSV